MYPDVQLFINGTWRAATGGRTELVINPATEETIGTVAYASCADLDEALEAAAKGFRTWRATSAFERYKLIRKAANLLRERADKIARIMTLEQGKPLAEAKMEVMGVLAARPTSASSKTKAGAWPPSSIVARFMCWPARAASCLPTGVEPVKVILRITGCGMRYSEISAGTP